MDKSDNIESAKSHAGDQSASLVTDAHAPGNNNADSQPVDWSVAVDLAWHANSNQPQAEAKKIAALAQESKDKSVAIVVQDYRPAKAEDGKDHLEVERLLIRNGQVTPLSEQPSQGEAKDLSDLLQVASNQAPGKNLALVFNDDGIASRGFEGDLGALSLPRFNQAVQDGLKGSGHNKLDVLDFDACLMGDITVIDKSKSIANHVVASSEIESGVIANGVISTAGQDFNGVLKDLLGHSQMTAGQVADDFVKKADELAAGEKQNQNLEIPPQNATLAHFDMSQIDQFDTALDHFGAALNNAVKDEGSKKQITIALQDAAEMGRPSDKEGAGIQHDLKSFIMQINRAVKEGKLSDPDGTITQAGADLLKAQSSLTSALHLDQNTDGYADRGYKDQGGLAAFLPGSRFEAYLETQNPLLTLEENSSGTARFSADEQARKTFLQPLDQDLQRIRDKIPAELESQLKPLLEARRALDQCRNADQFSEKYAEFNHTVWTMMHGDIARSLNLQSQAEMDRWFDASKIDGAPAWNAFVAKLRPEEK